MPLEGELQRMLHVPGRLFSVNPTTTRLVPRLFARNERVVCLFQSPAGPMAMVLVGAIFVSSIDTVWAGAVAPATRRVAGWSYGAPDQPIRLAAGAEMGRFNMGSTVIVLFGPERVEWGADLHPGGRVEMGRRIGTVLAST
jgi:phosphatidylserine decarboxylase